MYRKSQYIFLSLLTTLIFSFIPSTTRAQQVSIADASWQGNDYVIRFNDSLSYTVDLEASDSMLVLHFSRPVGTVEGTAPGPNGITATFFRNAGDSMVNLIVRGDQRVGYSTLWRPYTHRLIVHTFNWDSLNYPTEQYHKGLLSLELNLPDQARSNFSTALAFDNGETARKAASVLGLLYESEGKDSLAQIYLRTPNDADDFMALANIYRRAGDIEKATKFEELFHQKEGEIGKDAPPPNAGEPYVFNENQADTLKMANFFDDWRGIALVALAALFIIMLAVWFSRRPSKPAQRGHSHPHGDSHSHGHSHPETTQTSGTIVVPPSPPPIMPVAPVTPPAPVVVQEPSAETSPNPVKSSLHAPQIIPDPEAPAETVETTDISEPIQLPQPDALPVDTELPTTPQPPVAENPPIAPEPVVIPSPVVEPTLPAESTTTTETLTETAPASGQQEELKRGSSQAEQLRRRMEAAMSGSTEAPVQRKIPLAAGATEETTIAEARRLNVSRDYVELRNRIAELRKRIEDE